VTGLLASSSAQLGRKKMQRTLYLVCLLPLAIAGAAFAQPTQRPQNPLAPATTEPKSAEDLRAIKERVADWLKTCLADWDQATHMSKPEWRTTCERVATERGKFLLDNPAMDPSAGKRKR